MQIADPCSPCTTATTAAGEVQIVFAIARKIRQSAVNNGLVQTHQRALQTIPEWHD